MLFFNQESRADGFKTAFADQRQMHAADGSRLVELIAKVTGLTLEEVRRLAADRS
jgi:hypothetical protein